MPMTTADTGYPPPPEWELGAWAEVPGAERVLLALRHLLKLPQLPIPGEAVDRQRPVWARLEASRWLVQCTDCGAAQFTVPSDPRFFCHSCHNELSSRRWRLVVWPDSRAAVEAEASRYDEVSWAHEDDESPAAHLTRARTAPRARRVPKADHPAPRGR